MEKIFIKEIKTDIRDDSVIITADIITRSGMEEKMYRIHFGDYSKLPFPCREGDGSSDGGETFEFPVGETATTQAPLTYTGSRVEILTFLARKFKIYNSALSKVAAADITRKGLVRKLYELYRLQSIDKSELYSLCETVADTFVNAGYINDHEYAKKYALYRKEGKRWGRRRISEYLYSKGVPSDIIREVLDSEAFDATNEDVLYHVNKKYDREDLADRNKYMKITAALNRLGFSFDEIKSALADYEDDGFEDDL